MIGLNKCQNMNGLTLEKDQMKADIQSLYGKLLHSSHK